MMLAVGKTAPLFTLIDENGDKVALKDLRGKTVVVYFYPKDDTPGCTKEACRFRDLQSDFDAADTVILGISPDDAASHTRFIEKYNLPFKLLCDPHKKVMQKYGAWGEKMMYGKTIIGTIRSTALIGANGKLLKHWKRVAKAADHPDKVLAVIRATLSNY